MACSLGITAKDVLFCWHLLGILELHVKAKLCISRINAGNVTGLCDSHYVIMS